jgi:hypothetical protein
VALEEPSDTELLNLYNSTFDVKVLDPKSKAGQAHLTALRAIYRKGQTDAMKLRQRP